MLNYVEYGNDINWPEATLQHPVRASGLVLGGDPVVVGDLVGVATKSAGDVTDLIAVRHCGVFNLPVVAKNGATNTAVAPGTVIYIDPATCILSLDATKTRFGYALANGAINAGATGNIDILLKHGSSKS
jgi:predicted RecA/RadA family phage recombinase